MNRIRSSLVAAVGLLFVLGGCEEGAQVTQPDSPELAAAKGPKASPSPNAAFDLDFSAPGDAGDVTASSSGWTPDRFAPAVWETATFDGDDRLHIKIDGADPSSGFRAYQGKKYKDAGNESWHAGTSSRLTYRFYIDPVWETDGEKQQTGMWLVLGNASGSISAYPILEYQDSDANADGNAGFRAYVYLSDSNGDFVGAEWLYIGLPKQLKIDPAEGGWVTVEAQIQKTGDGAALKWRVNGKLVLDERGYNVFAPSTQLLEPILNTANFGEDQHYYYDDFALTEPGRAGNK